MTPRTQLAARESVRLDSRQPLLDECTKLERELAEAQARIKHLQHGCAKQNEEICQIAGKALGYPWFKDDQANFPGADESWGVCAGEHVAETIAEELARKYASVSAFVAELYELSSNDCVDSQWHREAIRIPSGNSLYIGPTKP